MRVIVDKLPKRPQECLFAGEYIRLCGQEMVSCEFQRVCALEKGCECPYLSARDGGIIPIEEIEVEIEDSDGNPVVMYQETFDAIRETLDKCYEKQCIARW